MSGDATVAARRGDDRRGSGGEPTDGRRSVHRKRLLTVGALAAVLAAAAVVVTQAVSGSPRGAGRGHSPSTGSSGAGAAAGKPAEPHPSFAVGLRTLRFVDNSRTVTLADGAAVPRTLITFVRYPAAGPVGPGDVADAPPARTHGPFPLVIFGHGFAVTPGLYAQLLQAWARAGYVVAAPLFPLENAHAPGGPDESDLTNQPADMSFVISELLAADRSPSSPLHGLIDPRRIAVSGHSDGGDTALAVAYDAAFRDPRVDAAMILSGAEIPGTEGFAFPAGGPPLLATQGTADAVNLPAATSAFFDAAPGPKYLLSMLGAGHLPPYSTQQPELGIVERTTIAFLDAYLKSIPGARARLIAAGNVPRTATLLADP